MYCLITLSFFCILLNFNHVSKGYNVIYLNQLYTIFLYNKEIAIHTIIIIFIMASLPPFGSFFAKFLIFIISIETKLEFITIIFLIFTLISTFYYLNFIQQVIFFKFKETKLFQYNENFLYFYFLRIISLFFFFNLLFLSDMYAFSCSLLLSCI